MYESVKDEAPRTNSVSEGGINAILIALIPCSRSSNGLMQSIRHAILESVTHKNITSITNI